MAPLLMTRDNMRPTASSELLQGGAVTRSVQEPPAVRVARCAPFATAFCQIIVVPFLGLGGVGSRGGGHAENQNTGSTTAQSHSACGNACGPNAGSCVCSDHPLDESSAVQAA